MKRSFIREILDVIGSDTVSFAGGLPDETLFPMEQFAAIAGKVAASPAAFQYAGSLGEKELRARIAARYTERGFPTDPEEILVTTGGQQALDLIARVHREEAIAVPQPAYLGALGVFAYSGLRVLPALGGGTLAYLMSDFSNPAGERMEEEERERTARSLAAAPTLLVEDGAYSELWFDHPSLPIAARMPEQSYHVGSFSKILAPGLRVGWVRASRERLRPLLVCKERADLHTPGLNQRIILAFWETYGLDGHIGLLRERYREKRDLLASALEKGLPSMAFRKPEGGMFLYGRFPETVDARKLALASLEAGAVFVPGEEFYLDGGGRNEGRFNFSHPTPEAMERGVGIIARTLAELEATAPR